MPIARFEMPDGRIARYEVPEGTTPEQAHSLIQESLSPSPSNPSMLQQAGAAAKDLPRQLGLTARYGLQGLASTAGIVTDPLAYLANQAISAFNPQTTSDLITGKKPYQLGTLRGTTEQALTAAGLPQPQTPSERTVGLASELLAGTGGLLGPATGLARQAPTLAPALSALTSRPGMQAASAIGSGLAGGEAKERGASPLVQGTASLIGGLGLPVTVSGIESGVNKVRSLISPSSVQELPRTIKDSVKLATLKAGQAVGYKIPPSTTNPTWANRQLESVAGKAAMQQTTSNANQEVTDMLARRALPGFGENTPLASPEINAYAALQADLGYRPIAALPGMFDVPSFMKLPNVSTSPKLIGATGQQVQHNTIPPYEAISTLRELRSKASDAWNAYTRGDGASLAPAKELTKQASNMEKVIEDNLIQRNMPDMMDEFRAARTNIAKAHTVRNAIVEGSGNVNAQKIAQQFEKDAPLTDELAIIGAFANTFPKAMANPKTIGSPGISKMKFGLSTILGGIGGGTIGTPGIAAAAIPFVAPGAAEILLMSAPYQRRMTMPSSTPSTSGNYIVPGLSLLQGGLILPHEQERNNY